MPAIDAEYLRVKQADTDWELTITRGMFVASPGAYEVLDKPATDAGNNPIRAKKHADMATIVAASRFADQKVEELKAEIDRRNADRDPEADDYITPEPPGNKPELIAALEADTPDGQSAGI